MSLISFVPDIYLMAGGIFVACFVVLFVYLRRRRVQPLKPVGHRDRTVESLERIAGALEAFAGGGGSPGAEGRLLRLAEQYEGMAKMGLTSVSPADVAKSIRNAVQGEVKS